MEPEGTLTVVDPLCFKLNPRFLLDQQGWGEAQPSDITSLLDNVIGHFFANLDSRRFNQNPLIVANSSARIPPTTYPEFVKLPDFSCIFLATRDLRWAQYSYQFAHELCHYIIDKPFQPTADRFSWFDETLCELASLFVLHSMANSWKRNPPFVNGESYSEHLRHYLNVILTEQQSTLAIPFNEWLEANINTLYKDRYNRPLNRIVAIRLLPVFKSHPELWQTLQYLKLVEVTRDMDMKSFLKGWEAKLPQELASVYNHLNSVF